ncbi:MAG: hypothetical protein AAB874_01425, partial [Patescibacteria group bacterium]
MARIEQRSQSITHTGLILTEEILSPELRKTEKCGIIGVCAPDAAKLAFNGLKWLQHRGQDAAGMSVFTSDGKVITHKDEGLVPQAITPSVLSQFGQSQIAIAHCRYLTSDKHSIANAQPVVVEKDGYTLALGHNGNFFDTGWFDGIVPIEIQGTSDSNKFAAFVLWERLNSNSWLEAFDHTLTRVQNTGSISAVAITDSGELFGMTDQNRNRPLIIARLPEGWVITSESVAGDKIGAAYVRKVQRNELVHVTADGKLRVYYYGIPGRPAECIFEKIYFSRPDSFEDIAIQVGRENTGKFVGQRMLQKGIKPTVVIPVYDSGAPASKGMADALGVPRSDGLKRDHYVDRTFIKLTAKERENGVNGKFNVIPDLVQGQLAGVGEDSIVRGTTGVPLTKLIRN